MRRLVGPFVSELVAKKSRFIASAGVAASKSDALAFLEAVRESDASHNCWAYRINETEFRYSDDGEPSGTAGKPIYNAICARGLYQCVVVITRYFGGTKLGAGGLTRAYAKATAECLRAAQKVTVEETVDFSISVDFSHIGALCAVVERVTRLETEYSASGCTITIRIPLDEEESVRTQVMNACKGSAVITRPPSEPSA